MRVLGFGTYDVRTHPRVQIVLDGLAAHGHDVRQLDFPLGIGTAGRVAALSHPADLLRFVARLAVRWAELVAGSARYRGRRRPDVIVVGYMGHFDVLLARMLFPRTPIVLDHLIFAADTAKDRGATGRVLGVALRGLDRAAIRAASIVVVDTPEHAALVPAARRADAVVVRVGAPRAWFAARTRRVPSSSPRVVFYGLFTPLQGTPAIARGIRKALKLRPGLRFTLVGDGQDRAQCRRILAGCAGVEWIDWVDSARLPRLVAECDVCLGILGTDAKAHHVVPNKVYQGMAAGCCVVTSDTAPQRQVLSDDVLYVPPGDADALGDLLAALSPQTIAEYARRGAARADRDFTASQVVGPLLARLTEAGRA